MTLKKGRYKTRAVIHRPEKVILDKNKREKQRLAQEIEEDMEEVNGTSSWRDSTRP